MSMKQHILVALREQFELWEAQLAGMREAQIVAPGATGDWSCKDVIAHLTAWQQRTNARVEAALHDHAPQFPQWSAAFDPEDEAATDRVNAWIYESAREKPWMEVHRDWREGFLRLLATAEEISERDFLDSSRYPWMQDHPIAAVLLSTYDHHQEHLEKLQALP